MCKIFLDPQKLSLRFRVAFKDAFLPSATTVLPRLWNDTRMLSQTDGRQAAPLSHTRSQHPKPQPELQPLAPTVAFGYRVSLKEMLNIKLNATRFLYKKKKKQPNKQKQSSK